MTQRELDVESLVGEVRGGSTAALARAVTIAEGGGHGAATLRAALAGCARPPSVGLTGPPGGGKSSLAAALVSSWVATGLSIGVVLIDPSSPLTGGAVLGDRVRFQSPHDPRRVFVRSLATRGSSGAVVPYLPLVFDVFAAAGKDVVIVETVGSGQSDIDVSSMVDLTVLVCPPGLGDDIQALKGGINEVADCFVATKSDLDPSGSTTEHLRSMVHASRRPDRPVHVVTQLDIQAYATLAEELVGAARAARPAASKAERLEDFRRSRTVETMSGTYVITVAYVSADRLGSAVVEIADCRGEEVWRGLLESEVSARRCADAVEVLLEAGACPSDPEVASTLSVWMALRA